MKIYESYIECIYMNMEEHLEKPSPNFIAYS